MSQTLRRRGLLGLASALLAGALSASPARASSDTWRQDDWSATSASSAAFPGDRTTWTFYQAKSSSVSFTPGTGLRMAASSTAWTSADASTGTSGFLLPGYSYFTGTSSNTMVRSSGTAAYVSLYHGKTPVWTANANWNWDYVASGWSVRPTLGKFSGGDANFDLMATETTNPAEVPYNSPTFRRYQGGAGAWAYLAADEFSAGDMLAAGDLDGDGDTDVITYAGAAYKNTGNATTPAWTAQASWNAAAGFKALADLDGDGDLDLMASNLAYRNDCTVCAGGSAVPVWTRNSAWDAPAVGTVPALADADGDGLVDLMLNQYAYQNVGNAGWPIWSYKSSANSPFSVYNALGDIDNDGDPDLVSSNDALVQGYSNTRAATAFPTGSPAGTYTSGVFDTGGQFDFYQISWSSFVPSGAGIAVQVQSGLTSSPDCPGACANWTSWQTFANGADLGATLDSKRYVRWKAELSNVSASTSPIIYGLSIAYAGYDSAYRELVSSVFDTSSSSNALRRISWTESLPGATDVRFQLRTSSGGAGAPVWTSWMGPDGTSASYFTDPAGGESVPASLKNGYYDRYFQYQAFIKGDGPNTPTLSTVTVLYGSLAIPTLGAAGLVADTSTQLTVTWTDNSDDEDDFKLSTGTASGPVNVAATKATTDKAGTGGSQNAVVSGLSPNTTYYVRLRAHETAYDGYGLFSTQYSTITHAAPPSSTPTYTPSASAVNVWWAAGGNPAGTEYYAEKADDADFTTGVVGTGWTTQFNNIFPGLTLQTTYYFRVKARNWAKTETSSVTLHAAQPVADPAAVATAFPMVGVSSITAQWSANGNAAYISYKVQTSTAADFTGSGDVITWAAGTSATVTGRAPNARYYFRVKSANPSLDEAASWLTVGSTVTLAEVPAYTAAASLGANNVVSASWGSGGNPAGTTYNFESSTDSGFQSGVSRYSTTGLANNDSWSAMTVPGYNINDGGFLAYDGGNFIYAFPGSVNVFRRYSISANSWTTLTAPGYVIFRTGAPAYDGGNFIYAFPGNYTDVLLRYSISANSWTTMAAPGYSVAYGGALIYGGRDFIYAFAGNNANVFLRYSISANSWTTLTAPGYTVNSGGALAYDGGNYIYAFPGDNANVFLRYSISANSWTTLTAPGYTVNLGGALAYDGGNYIYAFPGNTTNVLLRYSISANSWATLTAPGYTVGGGGALTADRTRGNIYAFPGNNTNVFLKYKLGDGLAPMTTHYLRVVAENSSGARSGSLSLGSWGTKPSAPWPVLPPFTDVSGSQIQVNWSSGPSVAGFYNPAGAQYYIEASTASDFTGTLLTSGWLTDTTYYAFTGLGVSTLYHFRGRAREAAAPANESSVRIFPSTATLPNTPGGGSLTSISSGSVVANWTANGNPGGTNYYAERASDAGFTQNVTNSGWTTALTFKFNTTPNTRYWFRVKARNAALTESLWNTAFGNTLTPAAPPTFPAVANVASTSLQFNWQANNNPAGTEYWVEVATGLGGGVIFTTAGWITATVNAFSGLAENSTYSMRVKARDSDLNETAYTVYATTKTLQPPVAPSALVISTFGLTTQTDRLHAGWSDNSNNEEGFSLQYSTDANFTGTADATLNIGANTTYYAPVAPLLTNTSYYMRVQAAHATLGNSQYSSAAALYTRAAVPGSPAVVSVSSWSVSASWASGGNPAGTLYTAEISTMSDFTALRASSATRNASATFMGAVLLPNATHYIQVKATNGNGLATAYTASASTITYALPPASPFFQGLWVSSASAAWNDAGNPGDTRYRAQVSTSADFSATVISSVTSNSTAAFTGAAPNSYYYLRVLALNGSGVASSTAMAAGPGLTYAQDPAATAATYALNVTSVTVFWSGQSNPASTQYRVQRSLIADNFSLDNYQDDSAWQSDRSSWTFYSPALVAGGTYYFRVKARDLLNRETLWVSLASTQTMVYQPGTSAQSVFTTSVTMRWGNSNPAGVQFQAEFDDASDFSTMLASSNWTNDILSYDFTGLAPNTHYYGRVRARNSSGVETPNTYVFSSFTRAAQPGLNLGDYAIGGTDILINWDKSGNPQPDTLYQAVRSTRSDFGADTATSAWISANNYNFSGLTPGATYYFRVKARNGDLVETPWTVLPSSVTLPAPAPPTGLVLSYADAASTDRVQLDWTDNATTEIGYYIHESTDGVTYTQFDNRPQDSVSYLRTTLTPAKRYYYKVSAYNANGGSFSNVVSSYTRAALPSAADFTAVQTNSLRANWGANGNPAAASYVCEISTMASFIPLTASSQTFNAFADFTGLDANVVYYAQVKAVNGDGVATAYVDLVSTRTLPLTMSFAVVDQAPTGILQGDSKAYARLNVSPSGTGASWTALTVKRDGTGLDADVTKVSLRRDGNLDGAYQAGNDPEVAWAAFASSQAALSFNETLNAAATYFLVMQAADNFLSWPGNTIGLTVVSTAAMTSSNSLLTQSPAPFTSALSTITKLADVLNVSGQDKAPMPNVSRGVANIVFMKLSLAAARDRAFVRQVAVDKLGTLADNMVAGVKLYVDTNSNGILNAGAGDALITSGNDLFSGGSAVLNLVNPSTRAAANETWFLTLDLDASAPLGATVGVRLANAAAVGLMAGTPDSVALNATPLDSATPAVSDPPNVMTVTPTDLGVTTIQQGESRAMAKIEFNTDVGSALWNYIRVQRSATSTDADYAGVALYRDNSPFGAYGTEDALISSGTLTLGSVAFNLSETILNTSTKTYFVTAQIAGAATVGNRAGVYIQSGYITAASAQTLVSAPFPIVSSTATITATVDVLTVTPDKAMAPSSVYQGDLNVPLIGLSMQTATNASTFINWTVNLVGGADGDISAMRVYKDDGNGIFSAANDAVVSADAQFNSGSMSLGFTGVQTVGTSPSFYFLVADIAAGAAVGNFAVRLPDAAAFGLTAPDIVSSTFPIDSNTISLEKFPATVLVSTSNLAPVSADAGALDLPMVKAVLRTNASTAQLNTLSVVRAGGADADISGVGLYWDADSNGALSTGELISSGTFSAGNLTLPFNGTARNLGTTAKDFYVTMGISPSAAIGTQLGVGFTALGLQGTDSVEAGRFPFTSGVVTVAEPASAMLAAFQTKIPTSVSQGASGVLVASAALFTSAYSASWDALSLSRLGTALDGDVTAVRLYRDDGNGLWGGPAEDAFVASATFTGGALSMSFPSEVQTTAPKIYYLTADFSYNATPNATFGVSLPAASYLSVAQPDIVDPGVAFTGDLAVINATVDTLVVTYLNLAPAVKQADVLKPLGRLTVRANQNWVRWNSVKLDKGGNTPDADVTRVRIYKDDGGGTFGAGDVPVGHGSVSNGAATITFYSPQNLDTTSKNYFVTADFSTSAVIGSSVSFTAADANFGLDAPDIVSVTAGPAYFNMAGTITDAADAVYLAATSLAPANVYQGAAGTAMARLDLWSVNDGATWSALKVALAGSGSPSDFAWISVYADANANGAYDAADLLLAKAAMSSSPQTLTLAAAQTITASTKTYFVTADIAAAAGLGGTLGVSFQDASYFSVGTDLMDAAALPFSSGVSVVLDPQTPMQPTVSLPDGAYSKTFDSIRFVWTSTVPTGSLSAAYYAVGTTPGGTQVVPWTGMAGVPAEVRATGVTLVNGATYYVSVKAISSWGKTSAVGLSGGQMIDYTELAKPAPPTAAVGASAVLVSWAPAVVGPSGVKGYLIEYRRGDSPLWYNAKTKLPSTVTAGLAVAGGTAVAAVSDADLVTTPPYSISGLPSGTLYFRTLTVNNAGVVSPASDPVRVQNGPAAAAGVSGVSSYPNPFDSRLRSATLNFTLDAAQSVSIDIYSIFGGKVRSISVAGVAGSNDVLWDGGDDSGRKVSKGLYLAVFNAGGSKATFKIGVIR